MFWTFPINGQTHCVSFCVCSSPWASCVQGPSTSPPVSGPLSFSPFHGCVILHCGQGPLPHPPYPFAVFFIPTENNSSESTLMIILITSILLCRFDARNSGNEGRGPMEAETRAGTWCGARERLAAHTNPCSLLPRCWPRFRT